MKTKAAILYEMYLKKLYTKSNPLRIEEVELDAPAFNEVVVKYEPPDCVPLIFL